MTLWQPLGLWRFVLWKLRLLLYTIGLVFPPKLKLLLGTSCLLCCSADQFVLNPLLLLNTRWISIWSCLSRSLLIFHMQGLPCLTAMHWWVVGFAVVGSPDLGKKSHRPYLESPGVVWTTTDILKMRLYFTFRFTLSTHTHTHIHESHLVLGVCFSFPTLLKEKTEAMHPVVNSIGNRNRVSKSPVLSSHALAPISLPEAVFVVVVCVFVSGGSNCMSK